MSESSSMTALRWSDDDNETPPNSSSSTIGKNVQQFDPPTCVTQLPRILSVSSSPEDRAILEKIAGKPVTAELRIIGAPVVPGPDWCYPLAVKTTKISSDHAMEDENKRLNNDDNRDVPPLCGILLGVVAPGVAWVRWPEGAPLIPSVERYRAGTHGKFDLKYA